MLSPPWKSASRTQPCPVCGRGDWCFFIPNGNAVCRRIQSDHPTKGGGWLHLLNQDGWRPPPPPTSIVTPAKRNDMHLLAEKFRTAMSDRKLNHLSRTLSLTERSLRLLEVGWCENEPMFSPRLGRMVNITAWSFPMRDASEKIIGLRMRSLNHKKFSFTGGAGGLFIPGHLIGGRGYLVEGPTDTGAALDLGLNAFGRESCSAGTSLIIELLKCRRFDELVILSQRDEAKPRDKRRPELGVFYPAQDGAEQLAGIARIYCPSVRIVMPPIGAKDIRIWLQQGATAGDVEKLVAAAPKRPLQIISTTTNEESLEGASL